MFGNGHEETLPKPGSETASGYVLGHRFRGAIPKTKRDYDEALRAQAWAAAAAKKPVCFSFERCAELFGELVASNFPADRRVKSTNKLYRQRAAQLNELIGALGGEYIDLFNKVEKELLELRGDSIVSNHRFNLVKIYFCNLYDWFFFRHPFSEGYIKKSYAPVIEVLREKECRATIRFIDLMLRGA